MTLGRTDAGVLVSLVLGFAVASAPAQEPAKAPEQEPVAASPWLADFDAAVARARKEGKDLLVDFTGSDWCGWCVKLDEEVFRQAAFLDAVKDRYVLVALDFPRGEAAKSKVPDPARNAEVAGLYGVGGYPTVILMTADGDVIAMTGYEAGGPANYVANLDRLAKEGREHLAHVAVYEQRLGRAKGKERTELLAEIVEQMEQMTSDAYGVRSMARLTKEALQVDKLGKLGIRDRALRAIVLAGVADAEVLAAVRKLDPKNKQGLFELLAVDAVLKLHSPEQAAATVSMVEGTDFQDRSLAAFACTNAAIWADEHLKAPERAKKLAKKALDAGAEGEQRARLQKILGS